MLCLRKYTENLGRLQLVVAVVGERVSENVLEEMTGDPGWDYGEVEELRLFCWVGQEEG